jgi:hypothetical protein
MDEEFVEIEGPNPYSPGSDAWHKHNLDIKPGVIGHVESFDVIPGEGVLVKGWFWDEVPKSLSDWSINVATDEATLSKE